MLIEQLRELEKNSGAEFTDSQLYRRYQESLKKLDDRMEELSRLSEDEGSRGLPVPLTEENKEELQRLIVDTAGAGETFLGKMQEDHHSLTAGIPGIVNRLQGLLSADFNAISTYDPKSKLSLQEIQEKARTRTIDLRGRKLRTVGNQSSSRIPMTLTNSRDERRRGVFTKASYNHVKSDFQKLLEDAKAVATPEAREAIDGILPGYKLNVVNFGFKKRDKSPITMQESDDYMIGHMNKTLRGEFDETLDEGKDLTGEDVGRFLRTYAGIDPKKINKEAMDILAPGLTNFAKSVTKDISNWNLELREGDRLDQRNTAMTAVADLLGVGDLIARSQPVKFIDDSGNEVEGTFMDYGKGLDLEQQAELFMHLANNPFRDKGSFMKQIADLQVLDLLCLNVDRHVGNILYQVDERGQLKGLQGIDNDSSFGTRKLNDKDITKLKVVSESMRNKLESISPEMLRFSLRGKGLSELEMDRACERLTSLKKAIKNDTIKTVKDSDFGKLSFNGLEPPPGARNVFSDVGEFITDSNTKLKRMGLTFQPLLGEYVPQLAKVAATERRGTVGGVEDMLQELSSFVSEDKGLVTARGQSKAFKELVRKAKNASRFYETLRDSDGVDKKAMLTEANAKNVLQRTNRVITEMVDAAAEYLNYKMDEKKVDTLDGLVGKNSYEQRHIDYAKTLLSYAEKFNRHLEAPKDEKEREETMANYEQRNLDMRKDAYAPPKPKKKSEVEQMRDLFKEEGIEITI